MTLAQKCPNCDNQLPPDAPSGLCPNCLLSAGLRGTSPDPTVVPGDAKTEIVETLRQAPPPPEAPGTRFANYELVERLAQGGMGVVYKARDVELGRPDFPRVVLDPAALRKDLPEFGLRDGAHRPIGIEHDGTRARRALIQREHVVHAWQSPSFPLARF